jgi:hypothetical protein
MILFFLAGTGSADGPRDEQSCLLAFLDCNARTKPAGPLLKSLIDSYHLTYSIIQTKPGRRRFNPEPG